MDESTQFTYDGKHCDEFGAVFLPRQFACIPPQTIPAMTVSGRHGTLRWPGRTFGVRALIGTLYLLPTSGHAPLLPAERLERASAITAWLSGKDGRARLVLDALADRFFWAEADVEAMLTDEGWPSGQIEVRFTCQPFAHALHACSVQAQTAAGVAAQTKLRIPGNVETMLAFTLRNQSGQTMDEALVSTNGERFSFSGLGLRPGETLRARYTPEDLLELHIVGTDGTARSAMAARQAQSDDDLRLSPGDNEVTVTTQQPCAVTLHARGRWL